MRTFAFGSTRNSAALGRTLGALTALALLAGCSGASTTPSLSQATTTQSTARTQSFARAALHPEIAALPSAVAKALQAPAQHVRPTVYFPSTGTLWVTDAGTNLVYRCTSGGCVAQQSGMWNEPQGIAADPGQNVYIADTANSRIVELNSTGSNVLAIYADPGQYPVGVAVGPKNSICATNIVSTAGGNGSIVCYRSGHVSGPNWTTCCALSEYYFDGFDRRGNLYVDGYTSAGTVVVESVANAGFGGTTEVINTGITNVAFPGGVEVERTNGCLDVGDQLPNTQGGPGIHQYPLGSCTVPGPYIALAGAGDPVTFGLRPGDHNLWTADAALSEVVQYRDPSGAVFNPPIGGFSLPIGAVYTPQGQV